MMFGCTARAPTLPVSDQPSDVARANIRHGRLDAYAGDPSAERVRVRALAIAERDGGRHTSGAGVRLFALHRVALRLASTEALRAEALADLRDDEPLLLALAARDGSPSVLALAAHDPELYQRHPDATRAAVERQVADEPRASMDERWRPWDVQAFTRGLPADLYATLYVYRIVQDPGPLEVAPVRELGAHGFAAMSMLLDLHRYAADLPGVDRTAARMLELDPTDLRLRVLRLAIARGEPIGVWREEGAYARALSELASPADVHRLASVSLAFALEWGDRPGAPPLVLPLLSHEDERVRLLARDVACAQRIHTECPAPSPETEAGRVAREARVALEARRAATQPPRATCFTEALPRYFGDAPATWGAFFACAESDEALVPPDEAYERLYQVPLAFAPRALAWLERLEATEAARSPAYTSLRLETAFGTHDFERARRVFATGRTTLVRDAQIEWVLAFEDAAYDAQHPVSEEAQSPELPARPVERSDDAHTDLELQFVDVIETLEARGCPPESIGHDTTPASVEGHLLAVYRRANEGEHAQAGDVLSSIVEAMADRLDPADKAYVLARASLHLVAAGRLAAAQTLLGRIHAIAADGYAERLVRIALARAVNDMDSVRSEARAVVGVASPISDRLLRFVDLAPEPVMPGDEEVDIAEPGETEAYAVCGVVGPTRATFAATGAPERVVALGADLLEAVRRAYGGDNEDDEPGFRFERLMRGVARDDATNALRCIAGATAIPYHVVGRYSLPASSSTGVVFDAMSAQVRAVVEACGRVPASRHTSASLHAWAAALRADVGPSRSMLESFVTATSTSESPPVLRTRISALVRLERFVTARDAWRRATHFPCPGGEVFALLDDRTLHQLAPDLGLAALHLLLETRDDELIALLREDWETFDGFSSHPPLHTLIASERRQGLLDRFTAHAFIEHFPFDTDAPGLLARNPRSLVVRTLAVRTTACGTRARCQAMAREAIASNPTNAFVALWVATYFIENGDVAEGRRVVVRALEANPDDYALRQFLDTRCGADATSNGATEPDVVDEEEP